MHADGILSQEFLCTLQCRHLGYITRGLMLLLLITQPVHISYLDRLKVYHFLPLASDRKCAEIFAIVIIFNGNGLAIFHFRRFFGGE